MKIVMLGAPGAGKGTQAKMISKNTVFHTFPPEISSVQISKRIQNLDRRQKTYMDKGLLVPDELVVDLVVDRLAQDDAKKDMYSMDSHVRFHRQKH